MPIRHGRNVGVFVNGVDISGDLNIINPHSEQELADVSAFGNVGHTFYPGLAKDSVTIEAIYASTEATVFKNLIQTDPGYAAMIPFGQALGDPVYATNECMLINNGVKSVVTDVNRASISLDVDNYPWEAGAMLTTGKQTVLLTGQGSAVQGVSCTTGAAYLQIFAVSTPPLTVSIQDSATGAFGGEQVTTCTFAAASTAGTQRISLSGTINAYARVAYVCATTSVFATALVRK